MRALASVSLTIGDSEVFGVAGPNGAGKSTMIALLLGYLEPTEGTVAIGGMRPRAFVERNGLGYLSELIAIPQRWKVDEALMRYAILAGVPRDARRKRIDDLIDLLGLGEHRAKSVKQLSKGNLQRLGLAQALLRDDDVLILDEPTHGLDPVWTQRFRDVVESLRRPGRAILIASHNLDELERLADRVAILDKGAVQRVVEPRSKGTSATAVSPYVLSVTAAEDVVKAAFPDAVARGNGEFELPARTPAELNAALAVLIQRGGLVRSLRPAHSVLEQHFREAIGE